VTISELTEIAREHGMAAVEAIVNTLEFENWARKEIARLRNEADSLDRALKRYLESPSHYRHTDKRRSKNDPILDAIDQAGLVGLSTDEIMNVAANAGLIMNRNNMRSFCWTAKQRGILKQVSKGRFASANTRYLDRLEQEECQ
jgi:hypothetical protein